MTYTPKIKAEDLLEPKYPIDINGTEYMLDGCYRNLKAVAVALNADLADIPAKVLYFNQIELAKALKALASIDLDLVDIEEWIFHEYTQDATKILLIEFLNIACTQKKTELRQDAQNKTVALINKILEALGEQTKAINSLGQNTSDSV